MRNKRALYGTLAIAAMGVMSSSFFGSNEIHEVSSISLSSDDPAAANSAVAQIKSEEKTTLPKHIGKPVQNPAAKSAAPAAAPAVAAAPAAAKPVEKAAVVETAKVEVEKPVAAAETAAVETPAKKVAATAKKEKSEEELPSTFILTSGGKDYAVEIGKIETETRYDENANRVDRKVMHIKAGRATTEGTICTDGCDVQNTIVTYNETATRKEKMDSIRAILIASEKKEEVVKIEDCEIVTPAKLEKDQSKQEVDRAICLAKRYDKAALPKEDKQDIAEKLNEAIVNLVEASKENRGTLRDARRIISTAKNADLRAKLSKTFEAAIRDLQAQAAIGKAKLNEEKAVQALQQAEDLCPTSQMQNVNYNQNQMFQQQTCQPAQIFQANYLRQNALLYMRANAAQVTAFSPSSFKTRNLIAQKPSDGGMTYEQLDGTFRSYVDFSNDVQSYTNQSVLSTQDRALLTGITGMEMASINNTTPGLNNLGLHSNTLVAANIDRSSWRLNDANGVQIFNQFPGTLANQNNLNQNNFNQIRPGTLNQVPVGNQFQQQNNLNQNNYVRGALVAPTSMQFNQQLNQQVRPAQQQFQLQGRNLTSRN
jgi:hypothetical protein